MVLVRAKLCIRNPKCMCSFQFLRSSVIPAEYKLPPNWLLRYSGNSFVRNFLDPLIKTSHFPLTLLYLLSTTIRYFSNKSANCCIPGKKARNLKTRVKTDTRISSPVSHAATCRFLSLQLPVETVTQIDNRKSRGLSKVSQLCFDNSAHKWALDLKV